MRPAQSRTAPDRIGILWRGDRHPRPPAENRLFDPLATELARLGVTAVPVVYGDEAIPAVRRELLELGGVLVWVDPIDDGRNRAALDAVLREVAARGVWVGAHPDVILAMATKEVLHTTRDFGWGSDTRLYTSPAELRRELPRALASGGPRVLKQSRGNGGIGVFRVDVVEPRSARLGRATRVRVQHARRGSLREELSLGEFIARCEGYFADGGRIVDQPFQARHAEGMVRCYLMQDRVAGFGRQRVTALMDPLPGEPAPPAPPPRIYCGPSVLELQPLKARLESEWVPQLCARLRLDAASLPALWDADFLLGPRSRSGDDSYVLCEINASSVFPYPADAHAPLARAAFARMRRGCA